MLRETDRRRMWPLKTPPAALVISGCGDGNPRTRRFTPPPEGKIKAKMRTFRSSTKNIK
jgi:hypothetical protein